MKNPSGSRRNVAERKATLASDLRAASHAAALTPDATMLSVRELSAQYGLALRTVSLELQKLAAEGVLYTVPRVGTFVGRPHVARQHLFLLVLPSDEHTDYFVAVRSGFEERIARLGATSLTLDAKSAREYLKDASAGAPSGVLEMRNRVEAPPLPTNGIPYIAYGELSDTPPGADAIIFDNVDGGLQATRHLLALGHRSIAFLGLHGTQDEAGPFLWSQQRETGWRQALAEAGISDGGLSFRPRRTPGIWKQRDASKTAAQRLLRRGDVTAAVVVNAFAARGLFEGLRVQGRLVEQWPAVVSFDSELLQHHPSTVHLVTGLRQPWEEIGCQAANRLWNRAQGQLTGPPQQHLVPMSLIPRLSCRREWHRVPTALNYMQGNFVTSV